jgi:CheY-like chemotaxis protein
MDMEMPVMDGYTAVKTIRKMESDNPDSEPVPIVALTAHALREHEQKSLDVGCTGHAIKPIKKAQLLSLIRDFACR